MFWCAEIVSSLRFCSSAILSVYSDSLRVVVVVWQRAPFVLSTFFFFSSPTLVDKKSNSSASERRGSLIHIFPPSRPKRFSAKREPFFSRSRTGNEVGSCGARIVNREISRCGPRTPLPDVQPAPKTRLCRVLLVRVCSLRCVRHN